MSLYDGNQLPENPTSVFQLLVSLLYTVMMCFCMSMGGFAAWATQKQLTQPAADKGGCCSALLASSGQLQHPTHYMSDLVHKRNSICRGLLAFIPAAYSLAHLYASTLHSSSLYSSSNIIFGALLGYSAFFMGKTLQQLVLDSDHMDTTNAVYETLYMLAAGFDRLRLHSAKDANSKNISIFAAVDEACPREHLESCTKPAWQHPWVLFNVFLAIGVQDNARIWCMFTSWIRKFRESSLTAWLPAKASFSGEFLDWIWPPWLAVLAGLRWKRALPSKPVKVNAACIDEVTRHLSGSDGQAGSFKEPWMQHAAYAYWLYSQNKSIRTITGSMVVNQGISYEVELAGCRSRQLYFAAVAYIDALTKHAGLNLRACWERTGRGSGYAPVSFITE
jgi:hypothetical protein